jgi:hypothetical protein
MCFCKTNSAFKEDFNGKIELTDANSAENLSFCCSTQEEKIKEWRKAHKLGSKTFQKIRKSKQSVGKHGKTLKEQFTKAMNDAEWNKQTTNPKERE